MTGLIGTKLGMTQVFTEDGNQVPVTVIQCGPCSVVQRKLTEGKDGYSAVQLGYEDQKEQRLTKAVRGHYAKAEVAPKRVLREFRVEDDAEYNVGDTVTAEIFSEVGFVDVTGVTKGRGFQGVVKRYDFGGGRKTHGGKMHRRGGSIGQCVSPARVMKNRKMPGHMGSVNRTTQNLKVVAVRPEDNVILVRGAVPGPNGGLVTVQKALKKG